MICSCKRHRKTRKITTFQGQGFVIREYLTSPDHLCLLPSLPPSLPPSPHLLGPLDLVKPRGFSWPGSKEISTVLCEEKKREGWISNA